MAGRKKQLPDNAKVVAVSLGPAERILLTAIEARNDGKGGGSQIVADALWHYWESVEKMPREVIYQLLPPQAKEPAAGKLLTMNVS